METKKEIRKRILIQRRNYPAAARHAASQKITERILRHPWYIRAEDVCAYVDFDAEVETRPLIEAALHEGKAVWLPKVQGADMKFYLVTSMDKLTAGAFGIPEPPEEKSMTFPGEEERILMLLPGIAFDRTGNRIGYGKGYYDRFLAGYPGIPKIGLAFEFQVAKGIPAEHTDVRVDLIITERGVLKP